MMPSDVVMVAWSLVAVSGFGAPLLSVAFCTRNSPRWTRQWRDVALGLVGVMALVLLLASGPLLRNDWRYAAVVVHLGIAQAVILWYNAANALRGGDRCG